MRKIGAYIGGFFLLCSIGLAAFLFSAHWQIRSIEPALPTWAQLDAALQKSGGPVALAYLNTASQMSPLGELGHPGILIEWQDGRRFLIDTGMPPDAAREFGKPLELLGAGPTTTFGSIAAQMGAAVDTVKGVAFTHLHNDHTEGLPGICAAQAAPATIYQAPLQQAELNHTTTMGLVFLEEASCPREALPDNLIKQIPGFPGLVAVSLGGHTPGSTLYAVRIGEQTWVFSGDITNSLNALQQDLPKPWVYSTFVVPEHTERTAHLRRWLRGLGEQQGVTVLPAHDVPAMSTAGLLQWVGITQSL
tara:strand:- start:8948 stop:9862 length:915 start_codon:yes stop_codon:yes gene_type:complete